MEENYCMRNIEKLTDNRFLNIKQVIDPDKGCKGYQFAERLGVDSVAFICYDCRRSFLLNKEYKPPVDEFVLGAFGGSLDKDKSKEQIVIEEVREEAGFEVEEIAVNYVGRVLVSTQMNQYCYLYMVYVDKKKQLERQPENAIEALATVEWVDVNDIENLEDWKAITIVAKCGYVIG